MPSFEEYTRLLRLGHFQSELSEILRAQGDFIARTGERLLDEEEDEEEDKTEKKDDKEEKKSLPSSMPEKIKTILIKKLNTG